LSARSEPHPKLFFTQRYAAHPQNGGADAEVAALAVWAMVGLAAIGNVAAIAARASAEIEINEHASEYGNCRLILRGLRNI
jgi:hypothetical protein